MYDFNIMKMEEKKLTGYPSIDKPWLKYYDPEFLKKPIPAMNIYTYLKTMTKDYGALTALSYYGKEISYEELFRHIDEAAKLLISIGVKSGDRVMYLMPNIPETAYFLYGGARIGAVADYIDPRPDSVDFTVSTKKVLAMFKEEKAKFLVSLDQCYLAMLKPIEQELKELGVEQIILVSASDSMDGKTKLNYLHETLSFNGLSALVKSVAKTKRIARLVDDARNGSLSRLSNYVDLIETAKNVELPDIEYRKDQLAVIVHTSGTSSAKPKPIPLTHDNLNAAVHSAKGSLTPLAAGNTELHLLPYFAAYGLVSNLHCALCSGHKLFEIPEFAVSNLGKIIKRTKAEMIIGTPSWLLGIMQSKELAKMDLLHLKMVTYGVMEWVLRTRKNCGNSYLIMDVNVNSQKDMECPKPVAVPLMRLASITHLEQWVFLCCIQSMLLLTQKQKNFLNLMIFRNIWKVNLLFLPVLLHPVFSTGK